MKRDELVAYLDEYLKVGTIQDESQNGLQVEGPEQVYRAAFAVDACREAFEKAAAAGAQILVVHHGLFWDKPVRLVGPLFGRVRALVTRECALYAAHLPLDMHPEVGNNAELARLLELGERRPFGEYHGSKIGIGGAVESPLPLEALAERLERATGQPAVLVLAHGPMLVSRVGCVSGGASMLMDQVAHAGFDTFITGEPSHSFFHHAAEYGLNVIFGGHYATETLGVKALARHVAEKLGLETVFLDVPTGL
jgi:dinuclear metal center YbgI/SA1388 family protein